MAKRPLPSRRGIEEGDEAVGERTEARASGEAERAAESRELARSLVEAQGSGDDDAAGRR